MTMDVIDLEAAGAARKAFRSARELEGHARVAAAMIAVREMSGGDATALARKARDLGRAASSLYTAAQDLWNLIGRRRASDVAKLQGLRIHGDARGWQARAERQESTLLNTRVYAYMASLRVRRANQVRDELSFTGADDEYIADIEARLRMAPRYIRVRVEDASGGSFFGVPTRNPDEALPNLGQFGWCDEHAYCPEMGRNNQRIILDNGTVIWGYQCWWSEVEGESAGAVPKRILEKVTDLDSAGPMSAES